VKEKKGRGSNEQRQSRIISGIINKANPHRMRGEWTENAGIACRRMNKINPHTMRGNGHTKRDNIPHKGQSLSDVQRIMYKVQRIRDKGIQKQLAGRAAFV